MQTDFLDFAIRLAKKSGEIIRANFHLGMKREWKSDDTPLTATDKDINQIVIETIEKSFPSHSVLSEEGSNIKKSEYTWVCDPIDGTLPFSHGYPTSVFALALTKRGKSILGVIYDPYMDRLLVAQEGKGAYLNSNKVQVSSVSKIQHAVLDMEIRNGPFYGVSFLSPLVIKQNCYAKSLGSMSYASMLVAAGEFAAMVGGSENPWDGAAVKIIVEEAGGKVTNLFGENQEYNKPIKGVIASNGFLHDTLIDLIRPLIIK